MLALLLRNLITFSRKVEPTVAEKLVTCVVILSLYLDEKLICALLQRIFECNKVMLDGLKEALTGLYKGQIQVPYDISKWKISSAYKACFKWLITKLDAFSVAGVQFSTLESIYKVTIETLSQDVQDSKNEVIQTLAYKFMQGLNERREDFGYNDDSSDDGGNDELYNFNNQKNKAQKAEQKLDLEMDSKAMKNNFVNIEENDESDANVTNNEELDVTDVNDHPLKGKLLDIV